MSTTAYTFAFDQDGNLKSQGLSGMFLQPLKYVGSPGVALVIGRLGDTSVYSDPQETGSYHAASMLSASGLIEANVSKISRYINNHIDGVHQFDGLQVSEVTSREWGYHGANDLAACWVSDRFGTTNIEWDLELEGTPKPSTFAYIAKVLDVLCGGEKYFQAGFIYKDRLMNYLNAIEVNASNISEQLQKFGELGGYFSNDSLNIDGPLPKAIFDK